MNKTVSSKVLTAICLSALAVLPSCRKDAALSERTGIVFGRPLVENAADATKGLDPIDIEKMNDMAVYATYEASGDFGATSEIGNYFSNVTANKNTSSGLFEPVDKCYWPIDGKLSFFAISPADAEVVCDTEKTGRMHLTVTPAANIDQQKDICYATPVLNKGYESKDSPVSFTFHHCLTYVYFSANYHDFTGMIADKGYKVKIDSLTITEVKPSRELSIASNGDITWMDKDVPPAKVSYVMERKNRNQLTNDGIASEPNYTVVTSLMGRLYLTPQQLADPKLILVYSFYKEYSGKEELVTSFRVEKTLDTGLDWNPGRYVHYRITINLEGLTELVVQSTGGEWIEDWKYSTTEDHTYDIR